MAEYLIQGETLTAIAEAIRDKAGTALAMQPGAMPGYIRGIQSGSLDTSGIPDDIVAEAQRVASSIRSKIGSNALTFAVMSDMHEMGDGDHADAAILERYRRANRNACQGVKVIADNIPLDFFANLGDLAWGSSSTTTRDLAASVLQAQKNMADITDKVESLMVPGNHDVDSAAGYLDPEMISGLIGGYRYLDLEERKVRIICLNTADTTDGTNGTERISGEQLQWFAGSLDLSGKTDVARWSILVLSHHPLDWGNLKPAANCLAAYLDGRAYSATHDGMAVSYDYTGRNAAGFIANIHGHVHCLKVGTISGTNAKRVAIPNACYGRNNEYGQSGNTEFGETDTYHKTDNGTGRNTAFCLISIDLDNRILYADCFGAGYDRIVSYGEGAVVTYSVTNTLYNAASTNGAAVVAAQSPYSAVITANSGYMLNTVTVTMGGADITSAVYSQGRISIPSVTGDVVITATAVSTVSYDVTNLVLTSEEQNSTAVYNGIGYKNGVYASESGDGSDAACVATGWIPYTWHPANVIYVRGAEVSTENHVRFYGWTTKTQMYANGYANGEKLDMFFTVEELEAGTYYKLTPLAAISEIHYIRISLIGVGENLIVTVNEKIVADGGSSGEDSGPEEPGTFTNLVPLSTTDGATVYNAPYGYTDGQYISASATGYGADAACVATGNIYMDTDVNAIYIKGAAWDTGNSHARFMAGSTTPAKNYLVYADGSGANAFDDLFLLEILGENYYKWTLTDFGKTHLQGKYYRLSLVGTGKDLIITHDEPITDIDNEE